MRQRHLFIIDPLPTLHATLDTSLHLAQALISRGHEIFVAQPWHLSWHAPHPVASVRAERLFFENEPFTESPTLHSLADFTAIHMRKDPPFDLDYIAATWELESVARQVHVLNHPRALREFNEKLAIFRFPQECREALVSADPEALLAFIQERAHGDAVLKPLMLYGGRGVRRIDLTGDALTLPEARAELLEETNGGKQQRLVQAFDPRVYDGEVRAFTVGGEPLAWCLKKPGTDTFLANTRAGATLHQYTPGKEELERVTRVARELARAGIAFAGFDLIGGFISEINLTSPRLLRATDDRRNYFGEMALWVETYCAKKKGDS